MPSKTDPAHYEDDPNEIRMCLTCSKSYCDNCLDPYKGETRGNKFTVIDAYVLARMYNKGMSMSSIAQAQRMNTSALVRRLVSYHIPTGDADRVPLDRSVFEKLSAGYRRYLTWEGEPLYEG